MQRLRIISLGLLLILTSLGHTKRAELHGAAEYNLLRKPYYIGLLRLAEPSKNPKAIFADDSPQQIAFRVKNDWSPRRFYSTWHNAIHSNNSSEDLKAYKAPIQQFLSLPKSYLLQGDTVQVFYNGERTVVRLNETKVFHVEGKAFFNTLLKAWLGENPPSKQFKEALLSGVRDDSLMSQFRDPKASTSRQLVTESWFFGDEVFSKSAAKDLIREGDLPSPAPVTSQGKNMTLATAAQDFEDLRLFIAARTQMLDQARGQQYANLLDSELKEARTKLYKMHRMSFQSMALATAEYPSEQDLADDGLTLQQAHQINESLAFKIKVNRYGQLIGIKPVTESQFESFNHAAVSAIRNTQFNPAVPELSALVFEKLVKIRFKKGEVR